MCRTLLSAITAGLLLTCFAPSYAAEEPLKPLAKPGENYVSLQVDGCGDKCAEFEIYIFDTGRLTFRSNNAQTSTKGVLNKSGMRSVYERVAKYLADTAALTEPAECTDRKSDAPFAVVQTMNGSQAQKATWSSGCVEPARKGQVAGQGLRESDRHVARHQPRQPLLGKVLGDLGREEVRRAPTHRERGQGRSLSAVVTTLAAQLGISAASTSSHEAIPSAGPAAPSVCVT